ncbi:hypothetical protein D5266_09930 [bacterium c-19]|nr:hypothetical protein [bacterium c-19]
MNFVTLRHYHFRFIGIQGKGAVFVAKIVGDYYNIVGLPIAELVQRLKAYHK